jgi:hypothetical protein
MGKTYILMLATLAISLALTFQLYALDLRHWAVTATNTSYKDHVTRDQHQSPLLSILAVTTNDDWACGALTHVIGNAVSAIHANFPLEIILVSWDEQPAPALSLSEFLRTRLPTAIKTSGLVSLRVVAVPHNVSIIFPSSGSRIQQHVGRSVALRYARGVNVLLTVPEVILASGHMQELRRISNLWTDPAHKKVLTIGPSMLNVHELFRINSGRNGLALGPDPFRSYGQGTLDKRILSDPEFLDKILAPLHIWKDTVGAYTLASRLFLIGVNGPPELTMTVLFFWGGARSLPSRL